MSWSFSPCLTISCNPLMPLHFCMRHISAEPMATDIYSWLNQGKQRVFYIVAILYIKWMRVVYLPSTNLHFNFQNVLEKSEVCFQYTSFLKLPHFVHTAQMEQLPSQTFLQKIANISQDTCLCRYSMIIIHHHQDTEIFKTKGTI